MNITKTVQALLLGAALHGCFPAHSLAAAPRARLGDVLSCATVDDSAARLACYDSRNPPTQSAHVRPPPAVPPTVATGSVSSGPSSEPSSKPSPGPASSAEFGLSDDALRRKHEAEGAIAPRAEKLTAHVTSVSSLAHGEIVLGLDNGQTWAQTQARAGTIIKVGEGVTITQGSLGGLMLRTESGVTTRVRRLK